MNLQSLSSLVLSLAALAFVVWVAFANPVHDSVYGPYAQAHSIAR